MRKTLLLITILFISAASFALSDMVSVDFVDGSRTVPIEELKDMYYSNTKDSFYLALEDTTYAFLADSSLHVSFLDSIEGQHKREREALIAFYKALDGDNWTNNTNWCSDKPLSEWEGILADGPNGFVSLIFFPSGNKFNGIIPKEIENLEYLYKIVLCEYEQGYGFRGIIPEELFHSKYLQDVEISSIHGEYNIVQLPQNHPTLSALHLECREISLPISIKGYESLETLTLTGGKIGKLPDDIGMLKNLQKLSVSNTDITSIPQSISQLTQLKYLSLGSNQLAGEFPTAVLTLKNLEYFDISNNYLCGSIPPDVANMMDNIKRLDYTVLGWNFNVSNNNFVGSIPKEVYSHPTWKYCWYYFYEGNSLNIHDVPIPAPDIVGNDIYGKPIDIKTLLKNKPYVLLYQYPVGWEDSEYLYPNLSSIKQIYEKYSDSLNVIFWGEGNSTLHEIDDFAKKFAHKDWIACRANTWDVDSLSISINDDTCYPTNTYPYLCLIDSNKNILFTSENLHDLGYQYDVLYFLFDKLIGNIDYYYSTDFSKHKQIDTLQIATIGNGIDIILMGDAYSDRQIQDGTYHNDMEYLYEQLFTVEPYRSFKEMFNVYYVNVVSYTEGYENLSSALCGVFGEETQVGGNDENVIRYARCAITDDRLDEAMVIVAMNSDKYAGTCYMYNPSFNNNYGTGLSISYFPKGGDAATFAQLLHHEALGHGFAKLADEYAYEHYGAVPDETITLHQEQQTNWGWWKNIDFTNDPASIRWSRLLLDERYQYDGLGAFEGGLTYWTGVWRPTENSIMRYNTGGFNAPSREAIYYRIHKLAYGDEWEYDYEKFVEWDAKNRKKADSPLLMPSREAIRNFVPTHPPVIKQMNWREALESEQTPQRSQIKAKEGVSVYDKSINQLPNTNKYVFTTYSNDEQ